MKDNTTLNQKVKKKHSKEEIILIKTTNKSCVVEQRVEKN